MEKEKIASAISDAVDEWMGDLIKTILSGSSASPKRGLWDRFKGSVSNLVYGRDNTKNPYYWRNRFGDDLGVEESIAPMGLTLSEYTSIRSAVDEAEREVNQALRLCEESGENLRLVVVLRRAAERLKEKIFSTLGVSGRTSTSSGHIDPSGRADIDKPMTTPPPTPATSTTPAPTASAKPTATTPAPTASAKPTATTPEPKASATTPAPEKTSATTDSFEESIKKSIATKNNPAEPEKNWLESDGSLSASSLPKALIWLNKKGVDLSDDQKVNEALGSANGIKSDFKRFDRGDDSFLVVVASKIVEIGDDFLDVFSRLGVGEDSMKKAEKSMKSKLVSNLNKGIVRNIMGKLNSDHDKLKIKRFLKSQTQKLENMSFREAREFIQSSFVNHIAGLNLKGISREDIEEVIK